MSRVEAFRSHLRDPLYRNGYALMANTAITSGLGVVFWILAAHIYEKPEIGRSAALIAAMMLISALTQMNFTSVLVRFLPRSGSQTARLILTAYGCSVAFAALASTLVVVIVRLTMDPGNSLYVSPGIGALFVISTCAWSVFNLQDGALTGLRRTLWVPAENGVFNVAKIALLFALEPIAGGNGIFIATVIPVFLVIIPVNVAVFTRFAIRNARNTAHNEEKLEPREIGRYIAGDYVSTLFGQSMTTLMPVLVAAILGNTANAYFYTAQTMGMALDLIAFNLAQSLTVEASNNEQKARQLTIGVIKKMTLLMAPLILITVIAAPWILRLYGEEFSDNATGLLRLMAISAIPKAVIAVHIAMARTHRKTHRNAASAGLQAALLIGGSVIFMPMIGINAVGWSAIFGQLVVALLVLPWMVKMLHHQGEHNSPSRRAA